MVPIPTSVSATSLVDTVATPTVRSSISTSASVVRLCAVLAVPVITLVNVAPEETLIVDAVTAATVISGVPVNPCAVVAVATRLPDTVNPEPIVAP